MKFEREQIESQAVRREITVPVDRAEAWRALCDASGLAGWLADEVELEIREGARGVLRWHAGEERTATVEEVCEQRRLALCWREGEGEESLVELTLDDVPGGTRIVVVEMPLAALDAVASVLIDGTAGHGPRMVAALA